MSRGAGETRGRLAAAGIRIGGVAPGGDARSATAQVERWDGAAAGSQVIAARRSAADANVVAALTCSNFVAP